MNEKLPAIDFEKIRPHKGSARDAFEEVTVQIFKGETSQKGEFFRIEGAGGDGGVEAYRQTKSGTKIAVQSKLFPKLSYSQWKQVTKSVKSAIDNHPTLEAYYIAINHNLTPAQKTKYEELRGEWQTYAESKGFTHKVEFIWWGDSMLRGFLIQEEYRDQLIYWFGASRYNMEWLRKKLVTSVKQLGERYTSENNVRTIVSTNLDGFSWGDESREEVLRLFTAMAAKWEKFDRTYCFLIAHKGPEILCLDNVKKSVGEVLEFRWPENLPPPSLLKFQDVCVSVNTVLSEFNRSMFEANCKEREEQEGSSDIHYKSCTYDNAIREIGHVIETLSKLVLAVREREYSDDAQLILEGEAGIGKSHVLGDLCSTLLDRGQPTLLLLGETFTSSNEPSNEIVKMLGWDSSFEGLLSCLNQNGRLRNKPAIICIDALNESDNRSIWLSHLVNLADRIGDYGWVKLLVSCRSDFIPATLPKGLYSGDNQWPRIVHYGFGENLLDAVKKYFEAYRIKASSFPHTLAEFSNGLFLKVFCEAFEGQALPEGPLSLERVMTARIEKVCERLQVDIDCEHTDTKSAIQEATVLIANNGGRPVEERQIKAAVNKYSPQRGASKSLYRRLVSQGILHEIVEYPNGFDSEGMVSARFPYERFSEYMIVRNMLKGRDDIHAVTELFAEGGKLAFVHKRSEYLRNRGLFRAFAILIPELYQVEWTDMVQEIDLKRWVVEDVLESWAWRSVASFTKESREILKEANSIRIDCIPYLLRIASIPDHPFNGRFIHQALSSKILLEREKMWTMPISLLSRNDNDSLRSLFTWCFSIPNDLISDEQAALLGCVLLWTCSSNHKYLRNRATIAAIKLLQHRPLVAAKLLKDFDSVNDPYVAERVYAVAAGVAMRCESGDDLRELTETVYELIFSKDCVTPNICIRDYALAVMEASNQKKSLPEKCEPSRFRPPYESEFPSIMSSKEAKKISEKEGWREINNSLTPACLGYYGDFGRYVMESVVTGFSGVPRQEPRPTSKDCGGFSAEIAKNWCLQRVEELGWTYEDFGKYDETYPSTGRVNVTQEEGKLERIGKKYQGIALHELLGYLADNYWLMPDWGDPSEDFLGAWQLLGARDFDPSQRLSGADEAELSEADISRQWHKGYPDPFDDEALCLDRDAWVCKIPEDFDKLLQLQDGALSADEEWLTLAAFYEWKEPAYERVTQNRPGELTIWVNIRSYLINKKDKASFISNISGVSFYGRGIQFPSVYSGWIGEYPYGKVYDRLREELSSGDHIIEQERKHSFSITACAWSDESVYIPSPAVCDVLGLHWSGQGAEFRNSSGEMVTGFIGGDCGTFGRPLCVKKDELIEALNHNNMDIVWCLICEKRCFDMEKGKS
ncbi:MAG: hypothetical protein PF495_20670, partial [Spirochaetales bacterium]|nr:hypothetical protein [Spirochaetales bacterium]